MESTKEAPERERHNVLDVYQDMDMERRLEAIRKDRLPFCVAFLNLTGDINISQALRSASLLGAQKAFIVGRRRYDGRGSVGVQHYLPIEKMALGTVPGTEEVDIDQFLDLMSTHDLCPIGIETGGLPLSNEAWAKVIPEDKTPCLVFGNEGHGLPEALRERLPLVSIPQRGVMRSFNVSAAASIVMWDLSNYLAGKENGNSHE